MSGTFGTGGDEPYAGMLADEPGGPLVLRRLDGVEGEVIIDAALWLGTATEADRSALEGATAPLLDIGCGPGRMVRAAAEISVAALGIDVSLEAVALTSSDGTPALQRSVFERLPLEGGWGTVLLMDGNIGIGGDPVALLERCGSLLAADGALVVEVDADGPLDETAIYTAVDESGNESGPFPWARIGHEAVRGALIAAGLRIERQWTDSGRYFVRARRSRGTARAAAMTSSTTTHTPSRDSA